MTIINKRMSRDEMFQLYPNQWIAFGDEDEGFYWRDGQNTGHLTALLIALCGSQKEAILVPFEGDVYSVNSRGVINSKWWEENDDEYWFTYDIAGTE